MSTLQPHDIALSKAKIHLMQKADSAFFTVICFSVKHVWNNSIKAVRVDGMTVELNPSFFMEMSKDQQVYTLLHASMHIAYMHQFRIGGRDLETWNKACDEVVDNQLMSRGFTPPRALKAQDRFRDMSAEQVYPILQQEAMDKQNQGGGSGDGEGEHPFGNDIAPPGQGEQDPNKGQNQGQGNQPSMQEIETQIEDMVMRAAMQSKLANEKPGSVPGDISVMLDKILNPKLPWQVILRRFIKSLADSDFSFRFPKRRYFPKHYLPSLVGDKLMNISIAADLSGSTSDNEVNVMLNETAGILRTMKPDQIDFFTFDTRIMDRYKLKTLNDVKRLELHGRGGTNINPVIQEAIDNKSKLLVVFSDGEFSPPKIKPKCPVLWLIYNNPTFTAPYGKVIHYEV